MGSMADSAEIIMLYKVARLEARTLLLLCLSVHCIAIAFALLIFLCDPSVCQQNRKHRPECVSTKSKTNMCLDVLGSWGMWSSWT